MVTLRDADARMRHLHPGAETLLSRAAHALTQWTAGRGAPHGVLARTDSRASTFGDRHPDAARVRHEASPGDDNTRFMSERAWPTIEDWLDNAAGANIADALAHGHRGEQLLELYAKDVRETATAVFGEVTLPALTL
ncbi:hypothetical protein ADK70_02655 [Streptomyces rimosus subsp. pseudoverticillatus]|uniref:hypothetical protein n=1 Tax=Streptomyces rimosus TaxID=1927 RepID=UPI0006B2658F|nr:hypothetical protein [Streptomyces rimosus]KOT99797.1 hypothetical protein ADK70_02655 [Streptomyces rimosus subsp. pseudoverticillatus]